MQTQTPGKVFKFPIELKIPEAGDPRRTPTGENLSITRLTDTEPVEMGGVRRKLTPLKSVGSALPRRAECLAALMRALGASALGGWRLGPARMAAHRGG